METKLIKKGFDIGASLEKFTSKSFMQELGKEFEELSDNLVERMRENAPIEEGDLRRNLQRGDVQISGNRINVQIGFSDPQIAIYGLKWHEMPFTLGQTSKLHGTTPEGGIGNKYIERVFVYHHLRILQLLALYLENYNKNKAR